MNLKRFNESLANGATINEAAGDGVCWKGGKKTTQTSSTTSTTENLNISENEGISLAGSDGAVINLSSTDFEVIDRALDHIETSNLNTNNTLALALGWGKDIVEGAGAAIEGNNNAFESVAGSVTGIRSENAAANQKTLIFVGGAVVLTLAASQLLKKGK